MMTPQMQAVEAAEKRRAAFEKFIVQRYPGGGNAAMLLADSQTWRHGRSLDAEHLRWHLPASTAAELAKVLELRQRLEREFDSQYVPEVAS